MKKKKTDTIGVVFAATVSAKKWKIIKKRITKKLWWWIINFSHKIKTKKKRKNNETNKTRNEFKKIKKKSIKNSTVSFLPNKKASQLRFSRIVRKDDRRKTCATMVSLNLAIRSRWILLLVKFIFPMNRQLWIKMFWHLRLDCFRHRRLSPMAAVYFYWFKRKYLVIITFVCSFGCYSLTLTANFWFMSLLMSQKHMVACMFEFAIVSGADRQL